MLAGHQLTVGFQHAQQITHRHDQVLTARTTADGPHPLQNLHRVIGILTPLLPPTVHHSHRHRHRCRGHHRHRGRGPARRLGQPCPQLMPGMIPMPARHLTHRAQNPRLLPPRGRRIPDCVLFVTSTLVAIDILVSILHREPTATTRHRTRKLLSEARHQLPSDFI